MPPERGAESPMSPAEASADPFAVNDRGRVVHPGVTDDERTWATFMHLSILAHIVLSGFAIALPIIMWQVKKKDSPFLDDHGKEAVNFQLSLIIYSLLAVPLGFLTCGVLFVVAGLVWVLGLVGMIFASLAANRGEFYRYPMTIRLIH